MESIIIIKTLSLIISQGINWTHIVSTRINNAVFEQLHKDKMEINEADSIIIDTKSFANNIDHTFVNRDFNILNTYYGAQTFEDWGLKAMVEIVSPNKKNNVFIAVSEPILNNQDIEFANVIEDNPFNVLGESFPNAPLSKLVTLAGISIEFKFHVLKNAINPIVVRVELFANVTDVIFV